MNPAMIIPIVGPLAALYMMYKFMPTEHGKQIYKREIKANTIYQFSSFYGGDKIKQYLKYAI